MITRLKRSFAVALLLALILPGVGLAKEKESSSDSWTGTLTAMSGTTVPATLSVQIDTTSYTVTIGTNTEFVRKFNGDSSLIEFALGDTLQIEGTLTGTTIAAKEIKDVSIQRRGGSFWGSVVSIDTTAQTFVLDPTSPGKNLVNQTITVNSATKVFQGNREGTFADLAVGMRVKVIGLWRKSSHTVVADRVLIQLTEVKGVVKSIDAVSTPNTITLKTEKVESASNGNARFFRKTSVDYTITLTSKTVIRDKHMVIIALGDVKVGDELVVRGLRTGTAAVQALQITDKKTKKTIKAFSGAIVSIDATAKTFVLRIKHGANVNVATKNETIYVGSDGGVITFADISVGDEVQVRGPITGTTITVNLLIDNDLPTS